MRLIIEPNYEQLSKWAANYVVAKIKKANPTAEKPFVLGLPTGSSPLGMYKNLIELNSIRTYCLISRKTIISHFLSARSRP